MPQLDRYLVFSEVFWFIIFFMLTYFLVYYFLRRFFYILRGRTVLQLSSLASVELLREERRQGFVFIPRHVEAQLLQINFVERGLRASVMDFGAYKQTFLMSIFAEADLEAFFIDFFYRILLAKPLFRIVD